MGEDAGAYLGEGLATFVSVALCHSTIPLASLLQHGSHSRRLSVGINTELPAISCFLTRCHVAMVGTAMAPR
jgi:hypothetical protein